MNNKKHFCSSSGNVQVAKTDAGLSNPHSASAAFSIPLKIHASDVPLDDKNASIDSEATRQVVIQNLLEEVITNSKDDFGYHELWNAEHLKWLSFINEQKQLGSYAPRLLKGSRQRDDAFAEMAVGYYLCKLQGWRFQKREPINLENGRKAEFVLITSPDLEVFCEVKRPSWKAEVARANYKSPRLKMPKHINGDGGFFDNSTDVRYEIKKAYPQIPQNKLSLLVLVDDLKVRLNEDLYGVKDALYRQKLKSPYVDDGLQGCFVDHQFEKLSALATLNYFKIWGESSVQYDWSFFSNPYASIKFPDDI